MNAFRWPGIVVVVGLLVAGLFYEESRAAEIASPPALVSPVPVVASEDARSSTWFCTAATADVDGLADALVTIANTSLEPKAAVVSVFLGGPQPQVSADVTEREVIVEAQSTIDLRLAELAPDSPLVSIAVEVEGGGVLVEKTSVGPTGVDRTSCHTQGAPNWTIPSGSTGPGSRLQLAIFNPFPDDAVVDIDFFTDAGARSPEDLIAVHVPSRSARLIEVGDVVAASDTVSTFIRARSGRVVAEAIQSFDGTGAPLGLAVIGGIPAPAEAWIFTGVSPAIGPAQLVVVNPGDTIVRADVEVYPSGRERFVEPFELTLRPGQNSVVELRDAGRLVDIDSFTLVVRSFDGPRIVAGMEQRPEVEEEDLAADFIEEEEVQAPSTGAAAAPGQTAFSDTLFTTVDVAEDDTRSAIHVFNPAEDTIVNLNVTIATQGASRSELFEVGPERTVRLPLIELGSGQYVVKIESSAPVAGAREITGLSSRSWVSLLAGQ